MFKFALVAACAITSRMRNYDGRHAFLSPLRNAQRFSAVVRLGLALLLMWGTPARAEEDVSNHSVMQVNGWTVYFSPRFDDRPKDRAAILRKIQSQTTEIIARVPAQHVKVMRQADIWVEASTHWRSLARYHATRTAVYQEGISKQKLRDVEIFGKFARQKHGSLILHELAHVYHDRKLKNKNRRIEKLYDRFKAQQPNAIDRCGKRQEAYALWNFHEFFATFTEAYFGETCAYPYNRSTMRQAHPEVHSFMMKVWGA